MSQNAYINPKVLFKVSGCDSLKRPSLYINPTCLMRPSSVFVNPHFQKPASTQPPKIQNRTTSQYSWNKEQQTLPSKNNPKDTDLFVISSKKIVRRKPNVIIKNEPIKKRTNSSFKLDKRHLIAKKPVSPGTSKFKMVSPKCIRNRSVVNKGNSMRKKHEELGTNKKLIKIDGILYKSTKRKLVRSVKSSNSPFQGGPSNHILNVQGEKFILSRNGTTLRRVAVKSLSVIPKTSVYFGGMTYRRKSDNTLVRTNSHRARQLVIQAKQKSLACLASRRRKINEPCNVFRKLGKCEKHRSGTCVFTHDKKNVDLCKKFLRGECIKPNCLLSHEVVRQKMATCRFFLEGSCGRDKCPYLHVKVSGRAAICKAFLRGYCDAGEECTLRHINLCPEFEKKGSCTKGSKCPYPHKREKRQNKLKVKDRKKAAPDIPSEPSASSRYYLQDQAENLEKVVPTRLRLNSLPSFISISNNN